MNDSDRVANGGEESRLRKEIARLHELVRINQRLHSSLDVDQVLETIVDVATRSLDSERTTLYLIDDEKKELWSRIAQGGDVGEIRLKMGQGIAGHVAKTGETVRIPDAHGDARFYPEIDAETGFRTRSMLCMPLELRDGSRVGVIQVMNKHTGEFDSDDEEYLKALSVQAAITIENARYLASLSTLSSQNQHLVEILEQRLRDLQEHKMVSMKQMARGIAHEIDNALAKGSSGVDSLRENVESLRADLTKIMTGETVDMTDVLHLLEEGLPHSLHDILESTSGIGEIVRRIRDFVRLDQEPLQFADLNDDLETVIKMCKGDFEEYGVALERQMADLPRVECRPSEINMLLRELLRNAIYYASEGKVASEPKLVLVKTAASKDRKTVEASFLDNGPGIPVSAREHIFDLFFTTKPNGAGHGLGLSECYAIATRNGGTLSVEDPSPADAARYSTRIRLCLPARIR